MDLCEEFDRQGFDPEIVTQLRWSSVDPETGVISLPEGGTVVLPPMLARRVKIQALKREALKKAGKK